MERVYFGIEGGSEKCFDKEVSGWGALLFPNLRFPANLQKKVKTICYQIEFLI